jgi:hypothetical protein
MNIVKKQLIPTVATLFLLAGCAGASAAASTAAGHGASPATVVAAHRAATPANPDGTPAGALPFPVGKGYTWVYRDTNSAGGSTSTNTMTQKITSLESTSGGLRVSEYMTMSSDSKFDGSVVWIFHPNGTITYPLGASLGGIQVTHSTGGIIFPTAAEAASGQPVHSTITMTAITDGQTITEVAHITVQGDGRQTVTVPAGTFKNATVLKMTMDATVDKISLDFTFKYWVAVGTGEVKSEGFYGGSTPNETGVLVSFTK